MDPKPRKLFTVCVIHQHPRVLLGMKKIGFGAGNWNGFGGKVEEGETLGEAARREVKEEAGVDLIDIDHVGVIEFTFENEPKILEVHFFRGGEFTGEPTESDEMKPQWFEMADIPFKNMWPSDAYWLPYFLKGRKFKGKFHFDKPSTPEYTAQILEKEIREVGEL